MSRGPCERTQEHGSSRLRYLDSCGPTACFELRSAFRDEGANDEIDFVDSADRRRAVGGGNGKCTNRHDQGRRSARAEAWLLQLSRGGHEEGRPTVEGGCGQAQGQIERRGGSSDQGLKGAREREGVGRGPAGDE